MKRIIIMLFVVVATTVNANAQTDPKDSRVNIRKGPGVYYPVVETYWVGALVVFKKTNTNWLEVLEQTHGGWKHKGHIKNDRVTTPKDIYREKGYPSIEINTVI